MLLAVILCLIGVTMWLTKTALYRKLASHPLVKHYFDYPSTALLHVVLDDDSTIDIRKFRPTKRRLKVGLSLLDSVQENRKVRKEYENGSR